ncbi:MAG: PEGA domain-containing protein, partial [Spirochaetales bacterium]|nr:PEGA domain-containing protein [Spirochaetales bacterium]
MKRINSFILVFSIVSVVFFGTGCMTSNGSLFSDVVSSDTEDIKEEEEDPGLTIRTSPLWCDVYISDSYAGISPVTELLPPGNYRITVEKEGYYTATEWVNYTEGDSVEIYIDLEPIIGFLQINTKHSDIKISTGWDKLDSDINELQIGRHLIEAELFGFEPWQKYVEITENTTTTLSINLTPSSFRFSSLFVNRKAFNPSNPAGLGESRISFDVTTYGTGELEILRADGESVLTHIFPSFTENDQGFSWNGKDGYGKKLPDGSYHIVVSGRDLDGNNSELKETEVTIDSSLIIRIRNTFSGVSGTLFCPTPDILPTGSFQLAL